MKKFYVGILFPIVLLSIACSPERDAPSTPNVQSASPASSSVAPEPAAEMNNLIDNDLLDIEWTLTTLNNEEIATIEGRRGAHIIFSEENRVAGYDGCNRLMGSYTLHGEHLVFGNMASTRMACQGVTDQTQAFNEALTRVATYSLLSDELVFRDASGLVLARFKKAIQPDVQTQPDAQ